MQRGVMSRWAWMATFAATAGLGFAGPARGDSGYPREHIYDTRVGPDEALVNVSLTNNRWPDCTTLESAIRDIFRLEGVTAGSDHDRAQALWKWFRIMVSSTGGGYAYEGPAGGRKRICHDPHKILTVYGHHQCDGLSWAMAPLWRAAGYMAFDSATHGHTTVALRYRDHDGVMRYHGFDPQGRFFWWDPRKKIVGTRTVPVMTANVYRHVLTPQHLHSLRTSLRIGETVKRDWQNHGHVVPSGWKPNPRYYRYSPGRTKGIYAVVGEEVQTLEACTDPKWFKAQLYDGSENVACSPPADGVATLHPAEPGKLAAFVYRLAPPYVGVDATVKATLVCAGREGDVCRLALSRDGGPWKVIYEKKDPGVREVEIDLGRDARRAGRPDIYTAYDIRIKAEFKTAGDVRGVGMNALRITVYRMFNKRTLPNLMPGENVYRVSAERLAPGWALRLTFECELNGKRLKRAFTIGRFPFYFRIDAPEMDLKSIRNYDQTFNDREARTIGYTMYLVPAAGAKLDKGLEPSAVEAKFRQSFPHPSNMARIRMVKRSEIDPMETNGFFPQSRVRKEPDERYAKLIRQFRTSSDRSYTAWRAAQGLGDYPAAVDELLRRLPRANIDLTLFICKALAQIADPKAIDPLLRKWRMAPRGAPGTRYIPDVLAAIGDRRVVPALVAKLKVCRFDFRFHIAHALGILGGPVAERALEDLARNDPFPAVREEAKAALAKLRAQKR